MQFFTRCKRRVEYTGLKWCAEFTATEEYDSAVAWCPAGDGISPKLSRVYLQTGCVQRLRTTVVSKRKLVLANDVWCLYIMDLVLTKGDEQREANTNLYPMAGERITAVDNWQPPRVGRDPTARQKNKGLITWNAHSKVENSAQDTGLPIKWISEWLVGFTVTYRVQCNMNSLCKETVDEASLECKHIEYWFIWP